MATFEVPQKWAWFPQSRYGMFIHWGRTPSTRAVSRCCSVSTSTRSSTERAAAWNSEHFDPEQWTATAVRAGMRYACLPLDTTTATACGTQT